MAPSDLSATAPHPSANGSMTGGRPVLLVFAATMFVGAGLLFWIQPMFAKMVLPLLGGSPSVWNTAIVFFQAALLAGYAYAHLLAGRLPLPWQVAVHLGVLVAAFLFLPVSVAQGWLPDAGTIPVLWLLGLLAVSIGLPFLAVAATAPLMQRWFSRTGHRHAADPYFLYGASNLGSILGLLGFPLVLAPLLSIREQSLFWTGGYIALAALIAASAWLAARPLAAHGESDAPAPAAPLDWRARASWIVYSAVPSALLLGVTGHITTDIAAAPLLWVVPLTLYLLTFVIAFARRPLISHAAALRIFPFAMVLLVAFFVWRSPIAVLLPLHLAAFFLAALMCHGELARRRPAVSSLTEFYLLISLGGLLGGTFTAVVAPVVFDGVYEYPIAIVAACALLPPAHAVWLRRGDVVFALAAPAAIFGVNALARAHVPDQALMLSAFLVTVLAIFAFGRKARPIGFALNAGAILAAGSMVMISDETLMRDRSFFGVYRVAETADGGQRILVHGTTLHGGQRMLADGRIAPVAYYASDSPVAEVIAATQANKSAPAIGIVGLGAGALACYRRPGEDWRFYEIDPLVVRIATDGRHFHLMPRCAGDAPVIVGDARLTLAREPAARFDLLVVDAFSSDAIPMHLMTREAFALYLARLRDGGTAVLHISNRFLDLRPIIAELARDQGLIAEVARRDANVGAESGTQDTASKDSMWVVIARDRAALDRLALGERWSALEATGRTRVWTDDYSNILDAIRWRGVESGDGD